MGVCAICLTRTGKTSKKSFHRFPFKKNPTVAERWVQWVRTFKKCSWTPCVTSVICSDHFSASAFDKSAFRVELNANSVPTIFLPDKTIAVSEDQTSKRKSPANEICTESLTKKRCGENFTDSRPTTPLILEPTPLEETFNTPTKCSPEEAIAEYEVTPKTSAPIVKDECCIGRRRALLFHDHKYEDTPATCRRKNIQLKKNLNKARLINKAQKRKIQKLKKRVESLKELLHTLGQDFGIGS